MGDQGSIYTCKNHTTLRWFDTKPNGQLVFMGELTANSDGPITLREAAYEPGNPLIRMRHYLSNRNPFAPEQQLPEPFTFMRMKLFMRYVFKMEELGYVFECECSATHLTRLPNETYESVRSHTKS
jgi:hypothetical protein